MAHDFKKYASIILDVSIDKALDYGIPDELIEKAMRGVRVEVPLRGHMRSGYIVALKDKPDFSPVKPIHKLISDVEHISGDLFELVLWMAKYYCSPLNQVLKAVVPGTIRGSTKHKEQLFVMRAKTREELQTLCQELRRSNPAQAAVLDVLLPTKKGILLSELLEATKGSRSPVDSLVKKGYLEIDILRIDRSPLVNEEYFPTKPKKLNSDQSNALEKIVKSICDGHFETHLLHGITGSGKTEVYLQAIDKALGLGKGAIMLVPEISLTAQTIERFRSRFEGHIAVLHHRLNHGERHDEWHKIRRGEAKIVIGARSAIFSPVVNLGLIIVDEEHENSYKQGDEMPCYNARDVAVMRANFTKAAVVLGSATPSLESYYNARKGKYTLSPLGNRADASGLPTVTIVNMKTEMEKAKCYTSFSQPLLEGIKRRFKDGEQTILFLNRRGYHTTLLCQQCQHVVQCPHCDVALTFHLGENSLSCHLCGFTISPPPTACPQCKSGTPMKFRGVGTEQIEKALHAVLPEIRTMRIDADTTKHKGSHQKLLRSFGSGKADVLIGTQMIAKGLHFPQVTLVGVLNSDVQLNIPDFRAAETVFQLITQVSGRAGRGVLPGEVVIQTNLPDNNTIQLASRQDYVAFYEEEIAVREIFQYPPFVQMVKIAFSGTKAAQILQLAEEFRQGLIAKLPAVYQLNPVIPAGHAKVKDKYRFQFLVRGPGIYAINQAIVAIQEKTKLPSDVTMRIDVNPSSTFF
jgi:primosomal protein N' (replication factor Y)